MDFGRFQKVRRRKIERGVFFASDSKLTFLFIPVEIADFIVDQAPFIGGPYPLSAGCLEHGDHFIVFKMFYPKMLCTGILATKDADVDFCIRGNKKMKIGAFFFFALILLQILPLNVQFSLGYLGDEKMVASQMQKSNEPWRRGKAASTG